MTVDDAQAAPPEVVAVVEEELRRGWWLSTLVIALPAVIAVTLGHVVTLEVLDGDWLAILFPGVIVMGCAWWSVRLIRQAITVKLRERRMAPEQRRQAVYVRGLTGTTSLAAGQDTDALGVLRRIWDHRSGPVVDVEVEGTRRDTTMLAVTVRGPDGDQVTAHLRVPTGQQPRNGQRVAVLQDPYHPRAVVDLAGTRRSRRMERA